MGLQGTSGSTSGTTLLQTKIFRSLLHAAAMGKYFSNFNPQLFQAALLRLSPAALHTAPFHLNPGGPAVLEGGDAGGGEVFRQTPPAFLRVVL